MILKKKLKVKGDGIVDNNTVVEVRGGLYSATGVITLSQIYHMFILVLKLK